MGVVGVKMKIMPSSPSANLEEIKQNLRELIEKSGGRNNTYSEEPVAFGLKAIISVFEWPEEKELEELEENLRNVENVNSVQMIDIRRLL